MDGQLKGRRSLRIGISTNRSGPHERLSRRTHAGNLQLVNTSAEANNPEATPTISSRLGRLMFKTASMSLARDRLSECLQDPGALCDQTDTLTASNAATEYSIGLKVINVDRMSS